MNLFLVGRMWVPDENNEDPELSNVHLSTELADVDCVQLTISTGGQDLLLELGDHQALMLAINLIEMCCVSRNMKAEDTDAAMDSLNRALNSDDEEEE